MKKEYVPEEEVINLEDSQFDESLNDSYVSPNEIGTLLNAQIDQAEIILTEQGFVSIQLSFKWDGYGQGIGLYNLDGEHLSTWVHAILETLEINSWSEVKGKYCRIIRSEEGWNGNIIGIQNIINNKKFIIADK